MSTKLCPDILRWAPTRWELFLGNKTIIRKFKLMVKRLRKLAEEGGNMDANRLCFLLYGPSRSGKTALVKFLVRCVTCERLDPETLNPCDGTCGTCLQKPELSGLEGLHATLRFGNERRGVPLDFAVVDCTKIGGPDQLREKLTSLSSSDGIRIFYFDEVHRLVKRGMDEMLLKEVEEKNFVWIFSSAKPAGLEDMFANRLLKFSTELPEEGELAEWLADRCDQWGIRWEEEAIMRVVEKSNRVVGTALHALALASLDPDEGLTLDLVENEWVVKIEV